MDPILNCLLAVCCPPEKAQAVMAEYLTKEGITTPDQYAQWLFAHFDLAPKGTLQPLKDAIAKHARGADYKG